ncbi:MAG: CDP-diacylglycerol--serine O-phosphatidyltransferase [Nitrospiraceae bacterium]|nr:CDP-diacylglycerol--serine O-phosphatidyltransferase [Nitrospiraceae bacterium]
MKKGIYIFPNALTLMGMFGGFYAIISAIKGDFIMAAWAVLIAMVFDGLDGFVARLTGSSTRFGVELDSLSDLVAFGVAPAVIIYLSSIRDFGRAGWLAAFLFVACGALRLARYNVQMVTAERKSFTGIPIPGAAVIMVTLVMFFRDMNWPLEKNAFVLVLTFALSLLMVSTLRFHGLKEINFSGRKPFWILVLVVLVFVVIATRPEISLFIFAMLYLTIGIIENIYLFARRRRLRQQ